MQPVRHLLKQGTDLRAVIDILAGQVGGDDLSSVSVHADMNRTGFAGGWFF
jgi:hypothetical protein